MSWTLLAVLILALGLALATAIARRSELARMESRVRDRERLSEHGASDAQLMHPVIDLSRCVGCGSCVDACPEAGVLDLVHGQAMVVRGAKCIGHALCEQACPVSAIQVTLANLDERKDVPVVTGDLEAVGAPGVFLAGEVTAHALIKTAIDHGTFVGAEVARRIHAEPPVNPEALDLCIIGAGPAGLACALEAKRHGLQFVVLEQEPMLGGTVAKYPRRKLVMTRPVELPLHGWLSQSTYTKEELIELWHGIAAEHELPIEGGQVFEGLTARPDGTWHVNTANGPRSTRFVCLALGRRGVPRRLNVPGEELAKVSYSLIDARSYQGRRILVVGGGESAIEAAIGLAEQDGNEVVLSYRKAAFFRIAEASEKRLMECRKSGALRVVLNSRVAAIHPDSVELILETPDGKKRKRLPNDDVFVMAGGTPPFEALERSGVSFDPAMRPAVDPIREQGTGLIRGLTVGLVLALVALGWFLWHSDYYLLSDVERAAHPKHSWLRPDLALGLWTGVAAVVLIALNLTYLVRKAGRISFGSLQFWMTSHIATGILAVLCAMVHSAMAPHDSAGGHAFWALVVLTFTGAIGRYFYAYVPRATNGRELEIQEVKARLSRMSQEWDQGQQQFRDFARSEVSALIQAEQWKGSFFGRVFGLLGVRRELRRVLDTIAARGREDGVDDDQIAETLNLVRRAHHVAVMAAHFEDLRGLLGTWRWVHRWTAVLLIVLLAVHVIYALLYSPLVFSGVAG